VGDNAALLRRFKHPLTGVKKAIGGLIPALLDRGFFDEGFQSRFSLINSSIFISVIPAELKIR